MGDIKLNLEVGDLIKDLEHKRVYKITDIYKYFIICKDFEGHKETFPKADFICGLIKALPKEVE